MSTVKVSVTLDESVLLEARRMVGARGLSAFINDVVAQRLQQQRLLALLAHVEAEQGPIDQITWEQTRAELAGLVGP